MALEIIGMYAAITGGEQNAVAQVGIPQDGVLRGIDWDCNFNLDADDETVGIELSFIATQQLAVNDVRGRISSISSRLAVLTAVGGHTVALQKWIGQFELMIFSGERIYLHGNTTAGVTGNARCNLHFDGGATVVRRSARR